MTPEVELLANYTYEPELGIVKNKKGDKVGSYTQTYGRLTYKGKTYKISRLAFLLTYGYWPKGEVDHINGDKHDDRFTNLRECSRKDNAKNRGTYVNNSLGVKGVYLDRGKYIRAKIQKDGKPFNLGTFKTVEEAKAAYNKASKELHKEFRRK